MKPKRDGFTTVSLTAERPKMEFRQVLVFIRPNIRCSFKRNLETAPLYLQIMWQNGKISAKMINATSSCADANAGWWHLISTFGIKMPSNIKEAIDMSFGNNLRMIRKEKGITQEELADMLDVSRQAVSKWESEGGYPETDKLIVLAKKLGVSLDYLMDNAPSDATEEKDVVTAPLSEENIKISTFDGSQLVNCISVKYSKIAFPAKNEPAYILQAIDRIGFFGAHTVILGWYENEDIVRRELEEITTAMNNGDAVYRLQYYTDIKITAFGTASRK